MGICYIAGAGDFKNTFAPCSDDLVIAADGGYDSLIGIGIRPGLLIGDLDSIKAAPSGCELIRHPKEKDETDMHLAYLEGVKRGYRDFVILGGCGGRQDHTFANYCLLSYIKEHGHNAVIADGQVRIHAVKNEKIRIFSREGATFSVFAFGDALGVSVRGAKYEAENIRLDMSFPLGVSNSFLHTGAEIEVCSGMLLVISEGYSEHISENSLL